MDEDTRWTPALSWLIVLILCGIVLCAMCHGSREGYAAVSPPVPLHDGAAGSAHELASRGQGYPLSRDR